MKITRQEIIVVIAVLIGIEIYYYNKIQKSHGAPPITGDRIYTEVNNAQDELYSWVEEGSDELGDLWEEELSGAKVLFYNDK